MIRSTALCASLVLVMAGAAVAEPRPDAIVRSFIVQLSLPGTPAKLLDHNDEASFGALPRPAQLSLFAGVDTTLSLVALGDRSPLKKKVGEFVWKKLLAQVPHLVDGRTMMRAVLVRETLAEVKNQDLGTPKLTLAMAEAVLVAIDEEANDDLKEGSLVYSAKGVLAAIRDHSVAAHLALLTVKPGVPAEVRKEAAAIIAMAAAVEVQQQLAEAKFVAGLEP